MTHRLAHPRRRWPGRRCCRARRSRARAIISGQTAAPYRILLTNDDGVRAPGLAALAQALSRSGEVTIVAPSDNHSGTGHGITLSDPIYIERVEVAGMPATGLQRHARASCVRVALGKLLEQKPDIVVSGVNRGSNFGLNAYISGTVAAAREAAMQGVPAIASSLDITGHPNYGAAAAATAQVVEIVKQGGLPKGVFLNVNVPAGAELKGLQPRAAEQPDGHGALRGSARPLTAGRCSGASSSSRRTAEPGSDVQAALDGYVAVTPLIASEFSESAFDELRKRIR